VGRTEHHFYAMRSVSIIFIEVKKVYAVGKDKLNMVAQVLAERVVCDYVNSKDHHWVPILGILCDRESSTFSFTTPARSLSTLPAMSLACSR
jgi:hypothetical protein